MTDETKQNESPQAGCAPSICSAGDVCDCGGTFVWTESEEIRGVELRCDECNEKPHSGETVDARAKRLEAIGEYIRFMPFTPQNHWQMLTQIMQDLGRLKQELVVAQNTRTEPQP